MIEASDLKPRPSSFELNGKTYVLKPFSLSAQIYFGDKYKVMEGDKLIKSGLEVLAERISTFGLKSFPFVAEITHYLMVDNSEFKSPEAITDSIPGGKKYAELVKMYQAIVECFGVAQPQIDELFNEIEAGKSAAVAI